MIFHPFLFAIFPVLFLVTLNLNDVTFLDALAAVAIAMGLALSLLVVFWIFTKNAKKAGMITSLVLTLLFSYGHVVNVINFSWFRHYQLLTLWGIFFLLGTFAIVKTKRPLDQLTLAFNIVSISLVIFLLTSFAIPFFQHRLSPVTLPNINTGSPVVLNRGAGSSSPDIYYILVDAYPSQWELKEYFGYDNSAFINHLEKKEFYVASKSHSNYMETSLSLPSLLNMDYLNNIITSGPITQARQTQLIQNNAVGRFLKGQGYLYINLGTIWSTTRKVRCADINWGAQAPSEFLMRLYYSTALSPIFGRVNKLIKSVTTDNWDQETGLIYSQWEWINYQLSMLGNLPIKTGPQFVFTHLGIPHDLVFNEDGTYILGVDQGELFDENGQYLQRDEYIGQLKFLNNQIETIIDDILDKSKTDPIIIIQSDHGSRIPHARQRPNAFDQLSDEHMYRSLRNFSAFHLPANGNDELYETITPVNTFRLIFNHYFNTDYQLLPDDSFASIAGDHYDINEFMDVTQRVAY